MRLAQFKTFVTYVIALNLILIAIGTILSEQRTVLVVELPSSGASNSSKTVYSSKATTTVRQELQPSIVPKIAENVGVAISSISVSPFNRTKWGDVFTFASEGNGGFNFTIIDAFSNKDFVIGIPTIARKSGGYLHQTLRSLIDNLQGYSSVVFLVYIGEDNNKTAENIIVGLREEFSKEIDSGMIHVILPPENYYPNWKNELRQSFNDDYNRVKWRSKQNIDQIYLMMYAYHLQPKYYLMLEDDVIAASDYLSKIMADAESKKDRNYVLISYCQLGAIGKLFRRELLPSLTKYFQLFWSDKPLDWLLYDYMRGRVCDMGKSSKDCDALIREIEIVYKPSLFQHIGTSSSFPGKIQKLKDKSFRQR